MGRKLASSYLRQILQQKIIIDDAEFIVNNRKPVQEIMPSFCLNNYAFIDEPPKIPQKLNLADDCQQEFFEKKRGTGKF